MSKTKLATGLALLLVVPSVSLGVADAPAPPALPRCAPLDLAPPVGPATLDDAAGLAEAAASAMLCVAAGVADAASTAALAELEQNARPALLAPPVRVWTSLNDGSASGLDADLLDGLESAQLLRSDASGTLAGTLRVEGFLGVGVERILERLDVGGNMVLRGAGARSYILHTDALGHLDIAPRNDADTDWDWPKRLQLQSDGDVSTGGSLGVGVSAPLDRLDVKGGAVVRGDGARSYLLTSDTTGSFTLAPRASNGSAWDLSRRIQLTPGGEFVVHGRRVGLGVALPLDQLDVGGNVIVRGAGVRPYILHTDASGNLDVAPRNDAGNGWDWPRRLQLQPDGDVDVAGHVYIHGQHVGDVAEPVVGEGLGPGDVVVLDGFDADGKLRVKRSERAYDRAVVGVVSASPSLLLASPGDAPLAVAGIVPVKVAGRVAPGELLVTSAEPGHAMACGEPSRCLAGVALGKALEAHGGQGAGVVRALIAIA